VLAARDNAGSPRKIPWPAVIAEHDPARLDPAQVRRAAERAAATYDDAAVLQREVGRRMAERLALVKLQPATILDAGCGTGESLGELRARYPDATIVGLDIAVNMLSAARRRAAAMQLPPRGGLARLLGARAAPGGEACFVCSDITRLPLASGALDLVWSNLVLHSVVEPLPAFAEFLRALRVGGLLLFTTFGPDTLKELRAAFIGVDRATHVGRFIDMHDLGDMLVETGFADPVMDAEFITLTYSDPMAMMRELKATGAQNATLGRLRGMMGRGRWRRVLAGLEPFRRDGRLPATCEIVYGHAWKAAPRFAADGRAVVHFEQPRVR
jgi:malonyl-CoA O-methyltransferase